MDITIQKQQIKEIQHSMEYNFDIIQEDDDRWVVPVSYCQMGCSITSHVLFGLEENARYYAAKHTFLGKHPTYKGSCWECVQKDLDRDLTIY
ncbi:hypothetical protein [Pontibacillus yanchengensis]|nr:hypothetical protein [Pontibacillus yanchengensis]